MLNMDIFIKQPIKLPIENFDVGFEKELQRHGELLPSRIRAVFCGPSNCGNTNSLLTLITNPNGLCFENVYVYSKSLNQLKFKFLEKISQPIIGMDYYAFS